MHEIHDLSTAAMQTELDYRRDRLAASRGHAAPTGIPEHGRWWHRRRPATSR